MSTEEETDDSRQLAATYFEAWRTRDWHSLAATLADDVGFEGVMGSTRGIEESLAGLRGMAEHVMKDLVLHVRVADGSDVMTWFDLVTVTGTVIPTANWSHIEHGKISRIRVTFDPTPLHQ